MVEQVEMPAVTQPNTDSATAAAPKMGGFSLTLKRKETVKLGVAPTEITSVEVDSDEEREMEEQQREAKRRRLDQFDGNVQGDEPKEVVTIPLVIENDWRVQKLLEMEKEGKLTEEDRARLAILQESNPFTENAETRSIGVATVSDKAGTVDADYSAVPIESYGLAILRGCGWREGEGIGRNPKVVPLQLFNRRPKGLGLGATPSKPASTKSGNSKDNEELSGEIVKDSLIKITNGHYKHAYGKVESRDDDNNKLFIRLAIGGETVKISLYAVQKVTKKEYDRDSKCLNKLEYDREKAKSERRSESSRKEEKRDDRYKNNKPKREHDYSLEGSSRDRDVVVIEDEELWVRPELIVRFINKKANSAIYKEKLRVVDVASYKDITLEDDRGRLYYNLRQEWMETVIPRENGAKIFIVKGRDAGEVAYMEGKDKERERVIARLIRADRVVTVDYDAVCLVRPKYEEDYD